MFETDPATPRRHSRTCAIHRAPLLLAVLTFCLVYPMSEVGAQEQPDTTVRPIRLAPVTVTVLRGLSSLERVPYAVSGTDQEALRRGKTGAFLQEAIDFVPGLQIQNRFNYAVGERVSIRGFGPRAQFGVRGVHVVVDGIPATMPDGQSTLDHIDLASLGQVEVLRGPGSAVYGNAAGGVLSFMSNVLTAPRLQPEARFVVAGNGLVNTSLGVGGRVGSAALTTNVSLLRYDGFRTNPREEGGTYGEADRMLFNGQLSTPLSTGLLRVTLNGVTLDAENPGSLPIASLEDDDRPAWGFNVLQRTGKEVDQAQLGAAWDGALEGGRASFAVWGLSRSIVNPIPPSVIDLSRRAGGIRAIFDRTISPSSRTNATASDRGALTLGAGVEAGFQSDERLNFENDGGESGAKTLDQDESVRSLGAFTRAEYQVGGGLALHGALRFDHFRFEVDDRFIVVDEGDPDDSGSRTMDAVSPTVGAVFSRGPLTLWANVSTALQTPTTTELANRPSGAGGFNPELDPTESTGFEVGARGDLLDGGVVWELAVFRTDLENELVPFEVPDAPGRSFFRNAGESKQDGFEAAVDAAVGGGASVRATYSRTDARFESFEVDDEDFSGNKVPGLAPNRFEVAVEQDLAEGYWAIDTEWVDAVPTNDSNDASAPSYWLVGIRAGLAEIGMGGLLFQPFAGISNLFDETYASSVTVNAFGGRYFEPGPGRTAHMGLSLRWAR